ncbi:MAG: hypothetical protein CFE28_10870 [Alphaproteobacteria bacterium PA2]|nr:MAG: hypothetical protein CFE28_10870 [Alphaproteobacteria bacterium PA2]
MKPDRSRLAARYMRVSSDQQTHALQNQEEEIASYAALNNLQIVRDYVDAGKSGLTLNHRPGLRQLMADIATGTAPFGVLLIQDVSRWGRFQDIDEAGHYEFLCRMAGIRVCYCSESFANDANPNAGVIKAVKRLMAAEFSRDLSGKVRRAQFHWAERGYTMGGKPGYGFRRVILGEDGQPLHHLGPGERKFIAAQRTSIIWGPACEVDTVRQIYQLYTQGDLSIRAIADRLNAAQTPPGASTGASGSWTAVSVGRILTNPKYCGRYDFGKRVRILGGATVNRPADEWLDLKVTCGGMVSPAIYEAARVKRRRRIATVEDFEVLQRLGQIIALQGRLDVAAIRATPGLPTPQTVLRRFGSHSRIEAMHGVYPPLLDGGGVDPQLLAAFERTRTGLWGPFRLFAGEAQLAAGDDRIIIAHFRKAVREGQVQLCIFDEATGRIIVPRPRMQVFFQSGKRPPPLAPPISGLTPAFRVACAFLHRRERTQSALRALSEGDGQALTRLEPDWSEDVARFVGDLLKNGMNARHAPSATAGSDSRVGAGRLLDASPKLGRQD